MDILLRPDAANREPRGKHDPDPVHPRRGRLCHPTGAQRTDEESHKGVCRNPCFRETAEGGLAKMFERRRR